MVASVVAPGGIEPPEPVSLESVDLQVFLNSISLEGCSFLEDFSTRVGDRLAALTDGEGCFSIGRINRHKPGGGTFNCSFKIKMRDDDRPFLEHMQKAVGLGKIYTHRDGPTNPNPCVTWSIDAKKELEELVDAFDRFPLWSKKRRDFKIWRDAVLYWNYPFRDEAGRIDWTFMGECRDLLTATREYRRSESALSEAA